MAEDEHFSNTSNIITHKCSVQDQDEGVFFMNMYVFKNHKD